MVKEGSIQKIPVDSIKHDDIITLCSWFNNNVLVTCGADKKIKFWKYDDKTLLLDINISTVLTKVSIKFGKLVAID